MSVVFIEKVFVELHHLKAHYAEAFSLKTVYNLTDESPLHCAGLEKNQCLFHFD